jgi:hypothetical protein
MSIPIKACTVVKAAKGDDNAFQELVKKMKYNDEYGHFSIFPCECDIQCTATDEELEAFDARVKDALKDE